MKFLSKFLVRSIGVMLITGGLCSCLKDVDLDQREEISLSPDVQIDLLIYDIDQSQFKDPSTGNVKTHISDTVRLEFLDDDYIQEDLTSVEFYLRHNNTFPREIESKIRFLSNGNVEQFAVNYTIKPGAAGNPVTTEQFEFIEEDRIHLVRRTIKMVVELEVQPGSAKFEGELDFASKGLFSFEF